MATKQRADEICIYSAAEQRGGMVSPPPGANRIMTYYHTLGAALLAAEEK